MTLSAADDSRPAYQVLAEVLRTDVESGALPAGSKLLSHRALAKKYRVAPMTAQNAVTLLRSEGLVYTSPGRGTFVAPDGPERARKVGEATVHSPAFVAISARLDELTNAVQDLSNRLAWLEARQDVQRPPGEEES